MLQPQAIIDLLITYRYFMLFPLALLEGPLASLVVGFLIYLGYFNPILAYSFLILGDIIPDVIYYYIGRFGNKKELIHKYSARFKIISQNFAFIERIWHTHGRKTMFLSKLAYGLSTPLLVSAGLVNMPFKKFILYAIPITLFQYGVGLLLGYYLGHSYQLAAGYIDETRLIIAGIIIVIIGYIWLRKYFRAKLIDAEKEQP